MFSSPYVLIAACVAFAGGAYVKGRADGRAVEIAQRVTLEEVAKTAREAAMAGAAEKIAAIEIVNKTIYQRATREVIEKPVYRDCRHDADALGVLNSALTNTAPAEPAGGISVPGTDATSR